MKAVVAIQKVVPFAKALDKMYALINKKLIQLTFVFSISLDPKVTNIKISLDPQCEGVPICANGQKVKIVQIPTQA